jgi:hypothetical protein
MSIHFSNMPFADVSSVCKGSTSLCAHPLVTHDRSHRPAHGHGYSLNARQQISSTFSRVPEHTTRLDEEMSRPTTRLETGNHTVRTAFPVFLPLFLMGPKVRTRDRDEAPHP